MNGCDETVHHEPLPLNPARPIVNGRSRCVACISVIKRVEFHPLDRDPTVQMSNARFNQDRYNNAFKTRALLIDRWSRAHAIDV